MCFCLTSLFNIWAEIPEVQKMVSLESRWAELKKKSNIFKLRRNNWSFHAATREAHTF